MNNPFVNLRKYQPDISDPKENHATEALAACLQFSEILRAEFVKFLFGESSIPFDPKRCFESAVATQVNVGRYGILDLYLSIPDELHILIEVKVDAPEGSSQLCAYSDWIKEETRGKAFLFSLVRYPSLKFPFIQYGVTERKTWRDLFQWLRRVSADFPPAEQQIIRFFCEYLEIQQIVTNWATKDLPGLGKGLKARHALENVFDILSERFPPPIHDTKQVGPEGEWPRLEIGKKEWKKIFGEGYNNKLYLWFTVPGIWTWEEHSFRPEIMLWQKRHQNDWVLTQPRIKVWGKTLAAHGYEMFGEGKSAKRELDLKSEIREIPKRIVAYKESATITEADLQKLSEGALIDALTESIAEHVCAIDQLA